MATRTVTGITAAITTDAQFQAYVQAIHDSFAVNMVQTSDTGQINPATVLRPTVANTSAGYEVWRFNDTLQATSPIYFKIEYYLTTSTINTMAYAIQVGTGSNGTGTVTGQLGTRFAPTSTNQSSATTSLWSSSATNRISILWDTPVGNNGWKGIWIERTKGSDGVDTSDGIMTHFTYGSTFQTQIIPFIGSVPTALTTAWGINISLPGAGSGGRTSWGNDVAVVPNIFPLGKWFYFTFMTYYATDIGALASTSITSLGGTAHTYLPIGQGLSAAWSGSTTNVPPLLLWE